MFRAATMTVASLVLMAMSTMPVTAATPQTASVHQFDDFSAVEGARSTLHRHSSGLRMTLRTHELPPGHRTTIWWAIFNHPEHCSHPEGDFGRCGPGDLAPAGGDPSVGSSLVYAAGHRVGRDGRAGYAGRLATGDTSGALLGPGITDPLGAEVHLAVREHGPSQGHGRVTQFDSCDPECNFVQFSVHLPPTQDAG